MAAALPRPLPGAGGLTLQYEAQITDTHACGGAYVKLLSAPGASGEGGGGGKEGDNDGDKGGKISSGGKGKKPFAPEAVSRRAPYSVMFGPDRCGAAARVHVILKLFNPARGNATEHHLAAPPSPPNDRLPHVYTLELSAANNRCAPFFGAAARLAVWRGLLSCCAVRRAWLLLCRCALRDDATN